MKYAVRVVFMQYKDIEAHLAGEDIDCVDELVIGETVESLVGGTHHKIRELIEENNRRLTDNTWSEQIYEDEYDDWDNLD